VGGDVERIVLRVDSESVDVDRARIGGGRERVSIGERGSIAVAERTQAECGSEQGCEQERETDGAQR
jgi:hypothetical protein